MTPQITVLMTAYNASPWIGMAINSVLHQSFSPWALLVVDDGSTDDTAGQVEAVMRQHPQRHISLLRSPHVNGCHATKVGIEASPTDLVTMLDSDDVITPGALGLVVSAMSSQPAVGYGWTRCRWGGRDGPLRTLPPNRTLKQALLAGWWCGSHQRFFRTSAYKQTLGLDSSIESAEDLQLAALFAELNCQTLHLPTITYLYSGSHRNRPVESACAQRILHRLRDGLFRRE